MVCLLSEACEKSKAELERGERLSRDSSTPLGMTRNRPCALILLGFRFRQWQGSLAKYVAPACRSADISVAKP
jgi:hypothetical protein